MADGPLPLLAVSRRWKANVLETPEVWTYVEINNSEDEEIRVHTFLYLSGQCLFDVRILLPLEDSKALSLIKGASTRLRAIMFNQTTSWNYSYHLNNVMEHLFSPGILNVAYPELQEVSYDGIHNSLYRPYPTLVDWCPKLRLVPFDLAHWGTDIVLKQRLESLVVWFEPSVDEPARLTTPESEKAWVSFFRTPTTLREVNIFTNSVAMLRALSEGHLQYLNTMELTCHCDLAQDYATSILILPALRDLTLHLMRCSLPSLHLTSHSELNFVSSDNYSVVISRLHRLAIDEQNSGELEKVLDVLICRLSFPTIQRIKLRAHSHMESSQTYSQLIRFMRATPSLQELEENITTSRGIVDLEEILLGKYIVLPELKKLRLLSIQIMSCMEVPKLEQLVFLVSPYEQLKLSP